MEASNGAVLQLNGASGGAFNNTSGTIRELSAATPSAVVLLNGATVTGGTLRTTGNGRASGMMIPRGLEYRVDVFSIVRMGPRRAWRELLRQSGNPNEPALAYFTCSGIRWGLAKGRELKKPDHSQEGP